MGLVKRMWMEVQERGYDFSDLEEKYVCANHFEDPYLRKYILENAILGTCSYCRKRIKVINLACLMEYIAGKICNYYGNPNDENLPLASSYYDDAKEEIPGVQRVGCFAAPAYAKVCMSTGELFDEIGLVADNDELEGDMLSGFTNEEWIQHNPFKFQIHQELSWKWRLFARMVKHEQRFTFFKRIEFKEEDVEIMSDNGLDDILSELSRLITEHNLYAKVKAKEKLYRCRLISEEDVVSTFESITSPPDNIAKQNRMSPAGVSMFYGAFDISTAVKECSLGSVSKICAVGEFLVKKDLMVLDLTKLPTASFWMERDWESIWFLNSFHSEITKSIERDDKIHIEYVPSQIFTEYFRYIHTMPDGRKLDGLIYRSSLPGAENNIVLFYNQVHSKDILELIKIEKEKL